MKKSFKILVILLLLLLFSIGGYYGLKFFKRKEMSEWFKSEVVLELGESISKEDLFLQNGDKAVVDFDFSLLNQVGEYKVKIVIDEEVFSSLIKVQDHVAPVVSVRDLSIYIDEEMPEAVDFVTKIDESSDFTIQDITIDKRLGEQDIEIVVIDKFGNQGSSIAKLTIKEDKDPPIFDGLSPISIFLGDNVGLKNGVSAFDKRFGGVDFTIDDSQVNYQKPGTYKIFYSAKDPLGNAVQKERMIEIKPKDITYKIDYFPTFHQYPNYPNGCESAALYNLLRYYHVNVSMEEIVNTLKKGDGPYFKDGVLYGGDPEIEFVGDPRNPHGYGVFQKPIIDVANKYKSGIIDYSNHSFNEVLSIVKQGIPVQVWGSINNRSTKVCTSWIYKANNKKINWICDLHSVVLIGYNSRKVYVSDSYTGNIEEYDRGQFENMYNLFGRRAIYYKG